MKIKRMVKRLFAVGTGVFMLGATAMGALAADLSKYPDMFVKDGVFDGYFVVGENAASVDNLAMTDIAASMKYLKPKEDTATKVTVEGDAWKVGTSAKYLEMANSNGTSSAIGSETFADIISFIGDEELGALKDGTWSTNEADYAFQQFMFFDTDADPSIHRIVKYVENDEDETADHVFFKSGKPIARYKMEFTSTAESDVTDSSGSADTTGTYLDDYENTDLTLLGKEFSVVLARRVASGPQGGGGSVKLTLMSGSTRDTLLEGETKSYKVGDKEYDVTLSYVDDDEAKFVVNGETTNKLKNGETYVLSDKSEVGVSEVLYQSYAGGIHSSTFFVGASKMELRDDDVSDTGGAYYVKVGSEDIDGTKIVITGSDNNVTFRINTIEVNMSAEDDYFVGSGEKLSDIITAADEEKEVLMNGGFEVEYHGLEKEETHELKLKSSSAKRYKLQLYDGDGNAVDIPIAYAETTTGLNLSEETGQAARTNQKRLIIDKTFPIEKSDYFIVTGGTASDGSAKSYLLQYKGADKSTKTSPKIQFKNMGTGETLEYSATAITAIGGTIATLKLGGYSFVVESTGSDQSADDYPVRVRLDSSDSANAANNATGGRGNFITFVDYYGSQWSINATPVAGQGVEWTFPTGATLSNLGGNVTAIQLAMQTPNADDYDTSVPIKIVLNITSATGPEVRANVLTSGTWAGVAAGPLTMVTPDGETEVAYGYSSMGTFIKFAEPSSDPDELTLTYPKEQALPQVYFTSGATTSSTSGEGTSTAVEVVDATKLDSEVADVKAQNLIVVGGPCVNSVAAELMGSPADCTEGFTPGKARIKLFESGNYVAMLVAGYSGADTRLAGKVVAHRASELTGDEVEVEGTTYTDATIGAPTVVETTTTEETVAETTTTTE